MKKKLVSIVLVFFAIGFIFYNSSKVGNESNNLSKGIINKVMDSKVATKIISKANTYLDKDLNKDKILDKLNFILRKSAHSIEFGFLAIMLLIALSCFNFKAREIIMYSLFFVLFFAVLDEFYQLHILGRTSSVKDVLIDFCGGIIGTCMYSIFNVRSLTKVSKGNLNKASKKKAVI
ncbi:VanZ family protein [Clostridium carnis]